MIKQGETKQMALNIMKSLDASIPIKSSRLIIKPVDNSTIEWYCKQMVLPYFSEYTLGSLDISMYDDLYTAGVNYIKKLNSMADNIQNFRFVALDKRLNTPIGGTTIFVKDCGNSLELSYWIHPEYQGIGLGTELLVAIRDTVLNKFGASKSIQLRIRSDNARSIKVAKKAGFIEVSRSIEKDRNIVIKYEYKGV